MLTTARPLFQNLPGTFADPLGLADQQAAGTTSLVVVTYAGGAVEHEDAQEAPRSSSLASPTYDAFVVASGGVVAVSRSTPDYRFPVAPAAAVRRFLDARETGLPPALSLFEVDPDDGARFLESTFFAECLKLHVDGPASTALVRDQLARCGTRAGLLEVNDFSDPTVPRLSLVEIADDGLDLDALLDGVRGRVLLYDRTRNRAVARDRAGAPLDLPAAIAEADRLATARRSTPPPAEALPAPPSEVDDVETLLRSPDAPDAVPSPDPHATGLAALVAELQGAPLPDPLAAPTADVDATAPNPPPQPATESTSIQGLDGDAPSDEPVAPHGAASVHALSADAPSPILSERSERHPSSPAAPPPHPLAKPLDALRTEVYALFEDAVGQDRALAHDAHVAAEIGVPSPVPAGHVAAYLRALLTADPPRRWHFFKRSRAKCYEAVAARLLAFHGAHGHDARPEAAEAVHQIAQLWARIHR